MTEAIATPEKTTLVPTKAELEGSPIVPTGVKADSRIAYPYVGWYGAKYRGDADALEAVGIEPGTFYLHDGEPLAVSPFEMHLVRLGRYYTQVDDDNQPIAARIDCPDDAFQDGFRDHLFFFAVVRRTTKSGVHFTPAVGTLRAAQAHALDKATGMLTRASDVKAWSDRSDAHAASAHAKLAGARFITTIWSQEEKTGNGRTMNKGFGSVRPTPKAEVDAFNAWYDANLPAVLAVAGVNNARIAACQKLLGK